MPKVTRDDVARLAGTSTAVVSYVVNNGPRPVAPATRERVLAAIAQLGYRPDGVAQAMAGRRTNLLGLVLPDARRPFFAELAHAVEREAFAAGRLVVLGNTGDDEERELGYVRAFLGMRVCALVLVGGRLPERAAQEVTERDIPVVLLHAGPDRAEGADGAALARAAVALTSSGSGAAGPHLLRFPEHLVTRGDRA